LTNTLGYLTPILLQYQPKDVVTGINVDAAS